MIASPTQIPPPPPAENPPISPENTTLSPQESTLLASLQSLNFDPFSFSQSLSPEDLAAFTSSPAVQDHLAALTAFAQQAFTLRALHARSQALSHLQDLANTTKDPIEKRRAASTLLRGLAPTSQPRPHSPNPRVPLPRVPASPPTPHLPIPSSPNPLPPPTATPFPTISDHNVAQLLLPILREPKKPTSIATLRAFCMPTTTLAGIPIPQDPQTFSLRVIDVLIDPQHPLVEDVSFSRAHSPSPTRPRFLLEAKTKNGPIRRYSLELARDHPDQPWLINSLAPGHFPPEKPP